jgi:hypothetical protein
MGSNNRSGYLKYDCSPPYDMAVYQPIFLPASLQITLQVIIHSLITSKRFQIKKDERKNCC